MSIQIGKAVKKSAVDDALEDQYLDDLRLAFNSLHKLYEQLVPPSDILQSISALSAKVDSVKDALIAIADIALTEEQATEVKNILK